MSTRIRDQGFRPRSGFRARRDRGRPCRRRAGADGAARSGRRPGGPARHHQPAAATGTRSDRGPTAGRTGRGRRSTKQPDRCTTGPPRGTRGSDDMADSLRVPRHRTDRARGALGTARTDRRAGLPPDSVLTGSAEPGEVSRCSNSCGTVGLLAQHIVLSIDNRWTATGSRGHGRGRSSPSRSASRRHASRRPRRSAARRPGPTAAPGSGHPEQARPGRTRRTPLGRRQAASPGSVRRCDSTRSPSSDAP